MVTDPQVMVKPLDRDAIQGGDSPSYKIPGPRFFNCPQGKTLTRVLPPGQNQVRVKVACVGATNRNITRSIASKIFPEDEGPIEPGTLELCPIQGRDKSSHRDLLSKDLTSAIHECHGLLVSLSSLALPGKGCGHSQHKQIYGPGIKGRALVQRQTLTEAKESSQLA